MKKLCKLFLLPYLLTLETYAAISKLMTWLVADKPYDQGNVKASHKHSFSLPVIYLHTWVD